MPASGMVADKSGKLIGILAQGRLDEAAAVDSLLYAIAGKYGPQCIVTEEYFGYRNYGWHVNDRTIQLYVRKPNPEHKDEVCLMVTKTKYDPFIDCISVGNWCNFNDLSSDVRSMEINPAAGVYDTGELFTEEDLVPDTIKGYMNIPDGELPKYAKVENRETTSSELEAAALYTIQRLPEFIPATQNGKPVAFRMTVALRFENR